MTDRMTDERLAELNSKAVRRRLHQMSPGYAADKTLELLAALRAERDAYNELLEDAAYYSTRCLGTSDCPVYFEDDDVADDDERCVACRERIKTRLLSVVEGNADD